MKIFSCLLFFLSFFLAGASVPAKKNHIVVQLAADGFKPWDALSSAANRTTFNAAVYRQPLYFTRDYRIDPGYVKEWVWDFKRQVYVLTIDDRIAFHNGQTIKASDLEFALVKPFISSSDRWEKEGLMGIQGINQLKPRTPYKPGLVRGIKVINDRTIEIALEKPNPLFLYSLGDKVPPLGPIDSFQDDFFTPKTVPVGYGSYKVVYSDDKSTRITVERVDQASDPAVPSVIDFFSEGTGPENKADLGVSGATGMTNNPDYRTAIGDVTLSIQVMDFNYSNRFAKELKYRQAIEMAIDKEAANEGYKFSRVADQLVASSFYGRAEKKIMYNPELAKKLVSELPESFRKTRHKAFYHGSKQKLPRYLQRIQEQLAKVGLDFEFIQSSQLRIEDKDGDIEMYVCGPTTSFVDPLNIFASYLPGGIHPNHAPKSDKTYVDLYQKAFHAPDIESRSTAIAALTRYCRTQVCQVQLSEDRPIFVYGKRIASIGEDKLFQAFDFDLVKLKDTDP